jgi:glucose/arabinose dehydrogenase
MSLRRLSLALVALLLVPSSMGAVGLPSGFSEVQIADGLVSPTAMALSPDGRIFVCEQQGRLRVVEDGALLSEPFLTVTVSAEGERGLVGVAVDPGFPATPYIYVYYTATTPYIHNRLSRFTAEGNRAVPGSETVLLELDRLSGARIHNGGALHFGPDGKLYVAVGENGHSANAQTLGNLLGKILRLNPDGSIPEDNPFYGRASGANRAIWALGLRNPFTFAFQPGTGRMLINDVGQNAWEEINDGVAGANYGWPLAQGPTTRQGYRSPIYWYGHGIGPEIGCAITGGAFYDPPSPRFPSEYAGSYFFADYCSGWIRRLDPSRGNAVSGFAAGLRSPVDLRTSEDGSLYYLQRGAGNGSVHRIQFSASEAPQIATQPADQRALVGGAATFSVSASGASPLSYQWRRGGADIPGARSPSYTLSPVSRADDGSVFDVVVANDFGTAVSRGARLTVAAGSGPTAAITSPAHRTLYRAGDTISYSGTGTDPENGELPPGSFTWQVDFHHDDHVHPFLPPSRGARNGSFTIPTEGETSANVWYRIHLTVADSDGLTHSAYADVVPRTSTLTLETRPPGLEVTLDGEPATAPVSVQGVVGLIRTLGAASPQVLDGVRYELASWSDGGAATHAVTTPAADTTYIATFRPAGAATGAGLGLTGTYYGRPDLTGPVLSRVDAGVDFDWSAGGPAAGLDGQAWSARWTGRVTAAAGGMHTFTVEYAGGIRLWIDGAPRIDAWESAARGERSGQVELTAGQSYDLRLEFRPGEGAALRLLWSAPGAAREVVPRERLHPYVLLIAGSTAADAAVRDRLRSAGWVPVEGTSAGGISGMAAVVVSSAAPPRDLGRQLRGAAVPVVTWSPRLFTDLGLTAGRAAAVPRKTRIEIADPSHPLAAGRTGSVAVTSRPAPLRGAVPGPGAAVVARIQGQGGKAAVFGYERGARMAGLTAPARRVGLFLGDTAAATLTAEGWALFDAAVLWASGALR